MIKRQTITSQVIDYVLDLIKKGQVKPGERLPTEKQLTESLQVSRTCVREAIKSLESLQVVRVRPRVGAIVLEPSPNALISAEHLSASAYIHQPDVLVEFRKVLEVGLAGLAAEKRTEEDLKALKEAIEEHHRAIQTDRIIHPADLKFHKAIAEATKNPIAIMVMQTISDTFVERSRRINQVPGISEEGLSEHNKIYRAIKEGNPEKARHAMLHHIETQERNARILRSTSNGQKVVEAPAEEIPSTSGVNGPAVVLRAE